MLELADVALISNRASPIITSFRCMKSLYYFFHQAAVQSQATLELDTVFLDMREYPLGARKTAPSSALGWKAALVGHLLFKL